MSWGFFHFLPLEQGIFLFFFHKSFPLIKSLFVPLIPLQSWLCGFLPPKCQYCHVTFSTVLCCFCTEWSMCDGLNWLKMAARFVKKGVVTSSFTSFYQGAMKAHKNGSPVSHHFPRWCPVADIIAEWKIMVVEYGACRRCPVKTTYLQTWCFWWNFRKWHNSPIFKPFISHWNMKNALTQTWKHGWFSLCDVHETVIGNLRLCFASNASNQLYIFYLMQHHTCAHTHTQLNKQLFHFLFTTHFAL